MVDDTDQAFLSLPDLELLALTAYGEARGEGNAGMAAVLSVIGNRSGLSGFSDRNIFSATGSLYKSIILKPRQFSMYNESDPQYQIILRIAKNFSSHLQNNTLLRSAYSLANDLVAGNLPDSTKGATHYHAVSVSPYWAATLPYLTQIGNHIFYGEPFNRALTASLLIVLAGGALFYYMQKNA